MKFYPPWLPVRGFEDRYKISFDGTVKAIRRHATYKNGRHRLYTDHVMTQFIDRGGYWTVKLTRDHKSSTQYIHRLFALTFLPNPSRKPIVNHINGNKLDNRLENLEWVTRSENHLHALRSNLCKIPCENKQKVKNICTGEIFPSMLAVSQAYEIPYYKTKKMLRTGVSACLELVA